MARKNESTNEKILRLFKEGYSIVDISKEIGIPTGNVDNIIRRMMPDMDNFIQPEPPKRTIFNTPLNELFVRKEKSIKEEKKEEPPEDPHSLESKFNLKMDESGFIDKVTISIAKMLNSGRKIKDVAAFFNCTENDVKAVYWNMDEHFQLLEDYEKAQIEAAYKAEENVITKENESEDTSLSKKKKFMITGLESDEVKLLDKQTLLSKKFNMSTESKELKALDSSKESIDFNIVLTENSTVKHKMQEFAKSQIFQIESEMSKLELDIAKRKQHIEQVKDNNDAIKVLLAEKKTELKSLEKEIAKIDRKYKNSVNKLNDANKLNEDTQVKLQTLYNEKIQFEKFLNN